MKVKNQYPSSCAFKNTRRLELGMKMNQLGFIIKFNQEEEG